MDTSARAALLSAIPDLRAFAVSLCGSRDHGDDLVQEALLSAWVHLDRFEDGTNMGAWLFTIIRNRFLDECRKRRNRAEELDEDHAQYVTISPEQEGWGIRADLRCALAQLPVHQREAVILVGAAGLSVAEAASVCGCQPGTIKSRLSRGRARLAELLAGDVVSVAATQRVSSECLTVAT